MKRVLSLILVLSLVLGMFPATFAEETAAEMTAGETLKSYGLLEGNDDGDLTEGGEITRAEMMSFLARLLGKEADAKDYTLPSAFTDIEGHWNANVIAYAATAGWTDGVTPTTFAPEEKLTEQQSNTFLLRALGYDGADVWETANEKAAELGIDSPVAGEAILRGEVFASALKALAVKTEGTEVTLGATLEIPAFVDGTTTDPVGTEVKIDTAVALNSKVIEVALEEAVAAVKGADFTVMTGTTSLEVESAKLAAWDTDKKTALVMLSEDTVAGTLYTIKSGEMMADFGGLAADEDDPAVDSATSTDYNEVKVTMTEAFDISTVKVTITEKYGEQDDLAVLDMEYSGNDKLVITTADQADATLYEVEVDGLADLAGNKVDDETTTFTGQEKNTDDQTVDSASAVDSVTVDVTFDVNVDVDTATNADNYTITAKYGDEDTVEVASAAMKLDPDDDPMKEVVRLTLATDTKEATLYTVEVANVGTLYGKSMDSDDDSTTFTGKGEDTDEPDGIDATSINNTEVKITVTDDSAIAEDFDITLVKITQKYGDEDTLEVTALKEVDADAKTITLTTAKQKDATLYEVEIAKGLTDKFGNVTTDELTTTFTGADVADAIEGVTVYSVAEGKLLVEFDQFRNNTALSVANYMLDSDIGYPTKVTEPEAGDYSQIAAAADEEKFVLLTVSDLVIGDVYELTVKNVKNSDGVAMDSDGVTDKFTGKYGDAVTKTVLEAVVATDDQTLKLYFNKAIEDIDGLLANNEVVIDAGVANDSLQYKFEGATAYTDLTAYAYEDPTNAKVLIVQTDIDAAFNNTTSGEDELYLKVDAEDVTDIDVEDSANIVKFAENTSDISDVTVDGIVAIDNYSIKVYFSQAVRTVAIGNGGASNDTFAYVDLDEGTDYDAGEGFTDAYALNDAMTEWQFVMATPMATATPSKIDFVIEDATDLSVHTATAVTTDIVFSAETDDQKVEFSKNTTSTDYIDDIGVVMTDSKTIKVIFPEEMDSALVVDTANWNIDTNSDTTLTDDPKTSGASDDFEGAVTRIVYDSDENTAYITLAESLGETGTTYEKLYLVFSDHATTTNIDIKNKAGNKTVMNDDDTVLIKEFSVSTASADEIGIRSLYAYNESNGANDQIIINLNQLATLGTDSEAAFLKDFDVTVDGTLLADADILAYDASPSDKVTEDAVTGGAGNDSLTITLDLLSTTLDTNSTVEVTISEDTTNGLVLLGSYNAEAIEDEAADVVSATAKDLSATDTVAPYIVSVTSADGFNADGETLVIVYSEAVIYTPSAATIAGELADINAILASGSITLTDTDPGAGQHTDDRITGVVSGSTLTFTIDDGADNLVGTINGFSAGLADIATSVSALVTDASAGTTNSIQNPDQPLTVQ